MLLWTVYTYELFVLKANTPAAVQRLLLV